MNAKRLDVFDPAMCCSTGVCGPDIDPKLIRFAADLEWLGEQGVAVERFNLAQQPAAFATNTPVRQALEAAGESALPVLLVDGRLVASGVYPSRDQLAGWFGLEASATTKDVNSACCCGPEGCAPESKAKPAENKPGCC